MFEFRNKSIYIISPERWGEMRISKHHYALELASLGCQVFFIEPPDLMLKGISVNQLAEQDNLFIVKYRPIFRGKRFLPKFVYRLLLKIQVRLLVNQIHSKPDVVFCFSGYLFENLKWFGGSRTIFFAADLFVKKKIPPEVYTADILLAVSDTIAERLSKSGKNVHLIGHGLNKDFVTYAYSLLELGYRRPQVTNKIIAGYSGNLRMGALDRTTMMKVIESHPEINFIFWGSYEKQDLNLGGNMDFETDSFIHFLESKSNVELRGVVKSNQLLHEMKHCNLFWICWDTNSNGSWDGSNSHKILEYMAIGKPIVAHNISFYKGSNLINMLPTSSNNGYLALFEDVVNSIQSDCLDDKFNDRIKLAIENSYANKIREIESIL